PILLVLALLMVVGQPSLSRYLKRRALRRREGGHDVGVSAEAGGGLSAGKTVLAFVIIFLTAIYGGYFAAAQGIILVALLGLVLSDDLQRLNGLKNVLV
ncbi:sulfite exporter TauE/SafE family protein, partial [Burkholderia multivorans]